MEKMASITSRSRHIILLSDGFPQDFDYGQDRRSNVYGLRDTTVALREVEAAGITPFCITVDKAGHDYLREMCDGVALHGDRGHRRAAARAAEDLSAGGDDVGGLAGFLSAPLPVWALQTSKSDRLPSGTRRWRGPHTSPSLNPQPRRIATSSAALIAFLNFAPDRPFTRRSHSAQVA